MIPMQGSYFETRVFLHSLLSQASKSIGFSVYTSTSATVVSQIVRPQPTVLRCQDKD